MPSSSDHELKIENKGGLAVVTLNRPSALNALTLEMIRILSAGLTRWESDPAVKAVVILGEGQRAFCAGGDVKTAYYAGMKYRRGDVSEKVLSLFFAEEYRLNRQLFHYKKPLIAFMDGIVMGGGFGVAGPCRYRIATENTEFAMPEVGIGFFPDVGSTWYLNRASGQAGSYLVVTGGSVGPGDMLACGMATHFIPSADKAALVEALAEAPGRVEEIVKSASRAAPHPPADVFGGQGALIDRCFSFNAVEEILKALGREKTGWAAETAGIIESRSPVSLKVSLAHLRKSRGQEFDAVIARDFILAQHFLMGHDFYEGVRAALIDKDRQPRWDPDRLEKATPEAVDHYFSRTGHTIDDLAA